MAFTYTVKTEAWKYSDILVKFRDILFGDCFSLTYRNVQITTNDVCDINIKNPYKWLNTYKIMNLQINRNM